MENAEKILALASILAGLIEQAAKVNRTLQNFEQLTVEELKALAAESRAARDAADAKLMAAIEDALARKAEGAGE